MLKKHLLSPYFKVAQSYRDCTYDWQTLIVMGFASQRWRKSGGIGAKVGGKVAIILEYVAEKWLF